MTDNHEILVGGPLSVKKSISPRSSETSGPRPVLKFIQSWLGSLIALAGATLIGIGLIPAGAPTPPGMAAAVVLVLLALRHLKLHEAPESTSGPAQEMEGALLLLVLAWLVFMLGT